jgi:hypothetical protein
MAQHVDSPPNHEEPEPQAIGVCRIHTMKGVENLRQMIGRYADAGIMDFDAHIRPAAPAAHKNSAARPRIFDRVADEIAQDTAEQDRRD